MITHRRTINALVIKIVIVTVLMIFAVAVLQKDAVFAQLDSWRLIPRPERITEIYFNDPSNLEKNNNSQLEQSVSFTIHNIEHRNTDYRYIIIQQNEQGDKLKELASGEIVLSRDNLKSITENVKLDEIQGPSKIIVQIKYDAIAFGDNNPTEQEQAINYWVKSEDSI